MLRTILVASLAVLAMPAGATPCSTVAIASPEQLVREADLIVRARATGYAKPPTATTRDDGGGGVVHFTVLDVVRGPQHAPVGLAIPGTLTEHDDYNDRPAPYRFVRKGGRGGNCFALGYRSGGEFLLFLKKGADGAYTP